MALNRAARRALQQEAFTLTLSVGGEFAGEQHWQIQPAQMQPAQIQPAQGGFVAHVETQFGGILPAVRQVQVSHYGPDYQSLHFSEQEGLRGKPGFETTADPLTGLLTLRQGRDEAVSALVAPHYDPVSLLMLLRSPQAPQEPWRASMTGGRVHVQPLEAEAHTRRYILRPGGAVVWVENEAPYRIVYLAQPTDFGMVEAHLEEAEQPATPKVRRRVNKG